MKHFKLEHTNALSILSSKDFTMSNGDVVRVFTVLGPRCGLMNAKHRLKVHTKHGSTDLAVMREAQALFGDLGHVEHVSPVSMSGGRDREWKVTVVVKQ